MLKELVMKEFKTLGYAERFLDLKKAASKENFNRRSLREEVPNQKDTRIVVGVYDILNDVPGFMDKEIFFRYYQLIPDVLESIKAEYDYKGVEIMSLVLVKLKANGIIDEHIDEDGMYSETHRVHIPLITNNKCVFTVGQETYTMSEGEIVEINNCIPHGVVNGDADRVHLIMDVLGFKYEYNENLLDNPVPDNFYIKE